MPAQVRASSAAAPKVKVLGGLLPLVRPHLWALGVAWVAAAAFAVLDATTFLLVIPFIDTLFRGRTGGSALSTDPSIDPAPAVGAAPITPTAPSIGVPPAADPGSAIARLLDGTLYRWVDPADPMTAVARIVLVILVIFALKNAVHFVRGVLVARFERGASRDLRRLLFAHLLRADIAFFTRTRLGDVVSRLTEEAERLRTLLGDELTRLASSCFAVVATVAAMLLISPKLTLIAFVVAPVAMALGGPMVKRLRRHERETAQLGAEATARALETLALVRIVKSSSAEARERERFRVLTGDHFRSLMRTERARALIAPATEMLAALGTVGILWFGARLVMGGDVGAAAFVGFVALAMRLFSPVKAIANFPAVAMPGIVAAERILDFLRVPTEAGHDVGGRRLTAFEREIEFRNVSFAYPGGSGLQELSLTVRRGQVVALVGPSGAGKSTAADLLAGFLRPDSGSVTIDGVDVREVRLDDRRSLFSLVPQGAALFNDTVRANIAYARPNADMAEVEAAARAAFAHDFIQGMPDGYDSLVGEGGRAVSGGERQRIAIARALLADRPILILDEATSSLDAESERAIRRAIASLFQGKTVIVIAHRLATVRMADEILVMDKGRIVERGNHDALMEAHGPYRSLHELHGLEDG